MTKYLPNKTKIQHQTHSKLMITHTLQYIGRHSVYSVSAYLIVYLLVFFSWVKSCSLHFQSFQMLGNLRVSPNILLRVISEYISIT